MEDNNIQYNIKKFPKRGLVYIIVNVNFTRAEDKRLGAETDYRNMKKLFKWFNLKLVAFRDKTAKQINDILTFASKRPDLAERPCFICIISSHGEQLSDERVGHMSGKRSLEHSIRGTDDVVVLTKDLVNLFSGNNCPHMRDKPKLFFIQACREMISSPRTGDRKGMDPGVNVEYIKPVVPAKPSKYQRMGKKNSTRTTHDSPDNRQEQSALDTNIEKSPRGKDTEDEEEEKREGAKEEEGEESKKVDAEEEQEGQEGQEEEIERAREEDAEEEGEEEEEEDHFSDDYDTATTDNDSDEDDVGRETGHDEVRNRDRSSYTSQHKDIVPEGDALPGIEQIRAVTPDDPPTDQADIGKFTRPTRQSRSTDIQEIESIEVTAIPCHDDMLVMFASPPGKIAWRGSIEGSWLLANLYEVFKHYIRTNEIGDNDFLTLLTEVSQNVSRKESTNTMDPEDNGMKMVPTIYHQLTKDIVMCRKPGLLKKLARIAKEKIPK